MSVIEDENRIYAARVEEAKDGWPFDADRDDPLTAHRIPVTSSHPRWSYLIAFHRESAERPTERERALLRSFLDEYKTRWYGDGAYARNMALRPLDMDSSANCVIFHKYGADDWAHRLATWRNGPVWVPCWPRHRGTPLEEGSLRGPLTLDQLMDALHTFGSGEPFAHWQAWKAAHPDLFTLVDDSRGARRG